MLFLADGKTRVKVVYKRNQKNFVVKNQLPWSNAFTSALHRMKWMINVNRHI